MKRAQGLIRSASARVAIVATAGVLLAHRPSARAQSPADEAEALIRQGTDLRHHGEDARALPYFEGAYHMARNPRTAAQLGLVKMALGYCVDAERLLDEALAVPDHPWIARNRAILEETRANARRNIGELMVTGAPDGAQVLVNGHLMGTLPLVTPLRLDRGPVDLRLQARGYAPATRALAIAGGAHENVSLLLAPASAALPAAPAAVAPLAAALPAAAPVVIPQVDPAPGPGAGPPAPAPPEEGRHGLPLRPLGWTASGVAAASLVFAIVETVTAAHRRDDFNDHTSLAPTPGDPTHQAPDCETAQLSDACRSLRDAWQRARTLAVVGYVGTGLFAGTAAALFVLAHRQAGVVPQAAGESGSRLACAPTLASPGVTCRLAF